MTDQVEPRQVTLIVTSRGRKWFSCISGGHKAQLLIDDVTTGLAVDRIVRITIAEDLSVRSAYGTDVKYRAASVDDDRSAQEAREVAAERREAERWLGYAEDDVARLLTRTRAVGQARTLASRVPALVDRLAALEARIAKVIADEPLREARSTLRRAVMEAQGGMTRTRAILAAPGLARRFPELGDLMGELEQHLAISKAAEEAEVAGRPVFHQVMLVGAPPAPGTRVTVRGQLVVVTGIVKARHRIDDEDPSVHGHHLLGFEGAVGCVVEYRMLTEAEQAQVDAEKAARAQEAAAAAEVAAERAALIAMVTGAGAEQPEGHHRPEGDMLAGAPDAYGGGDWFVVGDTHIWFVRNNGSDGDDWSRNNVTTGGAGGIGWRVPFDAEVAARIRALPAPPRLPF